MFKTRSLIAPIERGKMFSDLTPLLVALSESGWQPAILESERTFLKMAGVEDKVDVRTIRRRDAFSRMISSSGIGGDVFFEEQDVYYIVINPGFTGDEFGRRVIQRGRDEASLEIGVISSDLHEIDEKLRSFAKSVEEAIKSLKTISFPEIEWREVGSGTSRLDKITTDFEREESGVRFTRAHLTPERVNASQVLADKTNRDLLIELLQAGFAREQDILRRGMKRQPQIKKALQSLKQAGLIDTEYLLECKRTKTPLTRLKTRSPLQEPGVADLRCPSCGARFGDELLSEGYTVSDLGKHLAKQSHWMTIWTTNLLEKLGVPEETILWNISENGEEVDLLVEFLGFLWIFELKDREFGAGDAHPLNYRQVLYKADKAIIFTTEKVSKDAKRVFEELQREIGVGRRGRTPIYIEGLDKAEEILRKEIADASLRYARRRLVMVGEATGYDLGAVLSAKFNEMESVEEDAAII